MQRHEGPRPDPEHERQRQLTFRLLAVIGALVAALVVTLGKRYL